MLNSWLKTEDRATRRTTIATHYDDDDDDDDDDNDNEKVWQGSCNNDGDDDKMATAKTTKTMTYADRREVETPSSRQVRK